MKSLRNLINLFEEEIDPTKVVMDNDPIDPSKVVMDKDDKDKDKEKKRQWNPGVLGLGSRGDAVKNLQRKLMAAGISVGDNKDDGFFGPDTKQGVMDLQKKLGGITVDGVYGPATQAAVKANPDVLKPAEPVTPVKVGDSDPVVPIEPQADARAQYDKFKADDAKADARAQYDKFKADDAKADAQAKLKQMMQVPANPGMGQQSATYINPKTGRLEYFENGSPKGYAYDWMKGGEGQSLTNLAKQAGVEIKNVGGYAQIDPASLTTPAPEPAPARPDANASSGTGLKMPANFGGGTLGANMGQVNPPQQESVSFQNDELNRIVSLVHYR